MKLKNALFLSVSLLLAATPVVQAMEKQEPEVVKINIIEPEINLEIKQPAEQKPAEAAKAPEAPKAEETPVEKQAWFKRLGKKEALIAGGVAGTAAVVGAVSTEQGRGFIKRWTVDPLYNKYQAVKKNGVMQELVTKPVLGTIGLASAATAGWFGYRWLNNPENREQKDKVVAQWQQHKKKILIGAGVAAAGALAYKLLKSNSAGALSEDKLPEVDPKLQVWLDEVRKGIAKEDLEKVDAATVALVLRNPNLFILKEQHSDLFKLLIPGEKELFEEAVQASKLFVPLLNKKQKEELVGLIHEYNDAFFKEIKAQLAYLHQLNKEVHQKIANAKTAQELLALVDAHEAKEVFKATIAKLEAGSDAITAKEAVEILDINKNLLARTIYFTKQAEVFAASLKDASSVQKDVISQKKEVSAQALAELQMFYELQLTALKESFDGTQQEQLKKHNLISVLAKADKDASVLAQLISHKDFKKSLRQDQVGCIEQLQQLAAQQQALLHELTA